jgi:hypothetical protein
VDGGVGLDAVNARLQAHPQHDAVTASAGAGLVAAPAARGGSEGGGAGSGVGRAGSVAGPAAAKPARAAAAAVAPRPQQPRLYAASTATGASGGSRPVLDAVRDAPSAPQPPSSSLTDAPPVTFSYLSTAERATTVLPLLAAMLPPWLRDNPAAAAAQGGGGAPHGWSARECPLLSTR